MARESWIKWPAARNKWRRASLFDQRRAHICAARLARRPASTAIKANGSRGAGRSGRRHIAAHSCVLQARSNAAAAAARNYAPSAPPPPPSPSPKTNAAPQNDSFTRLAPTHLHRLGGNLPGRTPPAARLGQLKHTKLSIFLD